MKANVQTTTGRDKPRSYDGDYMAAGKNAEQIVMCWLTQNPHVIGVEDLRDLRAMREADVDLSLSLMDGRIALAEVKSDRHLGRSGNLLFEILRINHTAPHGKAVTLGWSARSPANWLLYFSPAKHAIYQITFDSFREGFQKYTEACRAGTEIRVDWTNTDKIKSTINVLVPEKYFTGIVIHRL